MGSVGTVTPQTMQFSEPLPLQSGKELAGYTLMYETYGTLNEAKDNAILITHFFSGNSHAAGKYAADDAAPGYWDAIIGPGKPIDTDKYFVVSADTLCYFGRLDAVCRAAAAALRPGGRFVFSVEETESGDGFTLQGHGRYGHTRAYVEKVLAETGLIRLETRSAALRMERGEPVHGLVLTAMRSL